MKLFETLAIKIGSLYEYYKPHYNDEDKTPGGSVKDWFKAMKVEPKDLEDAYKAAMQLPSFKKLEKDFRAITNDKLKKNGTFQFANIESGMTYSVYGNGVIRQERSKRGGMNHYITRLKAPKPALVHGSPMKSLVKIYDNAFKELASKGLHESEGLYEKYGRSWAILPATMSLYNRRTVDIITAASHWDDEWIYVCKNKEGRICFLGSSGPGIAKVGETHDTHHDQTGASKGPYKVINIVHIKKGEIVSKENEEGLNVKASLAVFK